MRKSLLLLALALAGCSAGSVAATPPGDVAMGVSDAIWWTVQGTGDPGEDGSVIVLLSSAGDLCHELSVNSLSTQQDLFALQAFSGTSDAGPTKASYPAGESGPHAEGRRYSAQSGCQPPSPNEALAAGALAFDDAPQDGQSLHGSFTGTMGGGTRVTVAFSASSCPDAAKALTGLARELKFRSCQ